MPTNKDIITAAREFNASIENCGINPQRAHEIIDDLIGEVEKLQRGEFICERCHLRKDAEFERGDF